MQGAKKRQKTLYLKLACTGEGRQDKRSSALLHAESTTCKRVGRPERIPPLSSADSSTASKQQRSIAAKATATAAKGVRNDASTDCKQADASTDCKQADASTDCKQADASTDCKQADASIDCKQADASTDCKQADASIDCHC
jgi:hypothetical protein